MKRELGTETMLIKKNASMIRNYFVHFSNDFFFSALTFWVRPESVILHYVKTLKMLMKKTVLLKKDGTNVEYYQKKELLSMSMNV